MTTREIYIAPDGDDDNLGDSPERPLRTLDEAERRVSAEWTGSLRFHIAPGTKIADADDDVAFDLEVDGTAVVRPRATGDDALFRDGVDCVAFEPLRCSPRLPRVGQSREERRRCLVRGEQ